MRAVEKEDESVYGLGTIKLVANLEKKDREGEASNQQLIDGAADRIMQLAENKGGWGLTTSEISVNLGLGRNLMNAALKKLIREDNKLVFEKAEGIPDGKVLIPLRAGEVIPRGGRPAQIAPPDPSALPAASIPPPPSAQRELFDPAMVDADGVVRDASQAVLDPGEQDLFS